MDSSLLRAGTCLDLMIAPLHGSVFNGELTSVKKRDTLLMSNEGSAYRRADKSYLGVNATTGVATISSTVLRGF